MHADPAKLSHHVHRVGHHFPLEIINLACSKFEYTYDDVDGLRKDNSNDKTNWIAQGVEDYESRQQMHGRPTVEKGSMDYIRGAVREMFPKIPEADLTIIVNHAFEKVCFLVFIDTPRSHCTGHRSCWECGGPYPCAPCTARCRCSYSSYVH